MVAVVPAIAGPASTDSLLPSRPAAVSPERPLLPQATLLPRRVDERRGADDVSAAFRAWYGAASAFEPIAFDHDPVGPKERVAYRIRLRPDWEPGTWHLIEQVAFLSVRDGRIRKIDLVCTGFMPDA